MKPDIIQYLGNSRLFATLSSDELRELAEMVRERKYTRDETIFLEGDPADVLYIVAEGRVKISKISSQGKETIISFFGPGEMFGEVAVFEDGPYPASSQAVDDTLLFSLRKSDFTDFLLRHPLVSLQIIAILSGRLRDAQNRLRDLAGERVEQRIARMLLMLSARLGLDLPFTRQEISDMSGTTTETTIRILSQWKNRGIIRSVRGRVIINNETKLRLLAEGPPI